MTTSDGLAEDDRPHALHRSFVEHDAFQCGYCTPGQICSAVALLGEVEAGWPSQATQDLTGKVALTDEEIRERMSGNICRCSAYPQIVAAIKRAAGALA